MVAAWYVVLLAGLGWVAAAPLLTAVAIAITVGVSIYLGLSLTLNVVPRAHGVHRLPALVESM
jgi:hypothetical protein